MNLHTEIRVVDEKDQVYEGVEADVFLDLLQYGDEDAIVHIDGRGMFRYNGYTLKSTVQDFGSVHRVSSAGIIHMALPTENKE